MSSAYDREQLMDGSLSGATTSLLRIVGGWGNITGPSIFMLRSMIAGSASAVAFGLAGASTSAILFGTASIPYVVSTTLGFVIGIVGFYKDSLSKAFINLELYPRLIQLHLDVNFPSRGFRRMGLREFQALQFSRSWTLRSMLLISWLTAQPAIDQITEAREKMLVEEAIQNAKEGRAPQRVKDDRDEE